MDYMPRDLQEAPSLTTNSGQQIQGDKWTSYLAGSDAKHSSVGTRIDLASLIHLPVIGRSPVDPPGTVIPQQVELRAVLVLVSEKKKTGPEIVTSTQFLQGFSGALSWKLTEVSTHPGIATNWGVLNNKRQDMSFDGRVELPAPRPDVVTVLPVFKKNLFVKDYAAAAKVHAEMRILVGRDVSKVHTAKTTARVLPTDDDRDSLPDVWERDVVKDTTLKALTDEDRDRSPLRNRRPLQTEPGDGLSAWEEMRGFRVKGKHRRTDEMEDDTPLVAGGIVIGNKGGPHVKDLFIDLFGDLFRRHGAETALYGFSAHLIASNDAFIPPSGPERDVFGQINRMTPPGLRVPMPGVAAQFRIRFVPDFGLKAFGDAQADILRSPASVLLNVDLLTRRLTSTSEGGYGFIRKDKRTLDRIALRQRTLIAHETGHRFTMLHPLKQVPMSRTRVTTREAWSSGLTPEAALFDKDEVRTVRFLIDGKPVVRTGLVRPVKVRVIADSVLLPPPARLQVYPIQFPKDIQFPSLPGQPKIQFDPSLPLPSTLAVYRLDQALGWNDPAFKYAHRCPRSAADCTDYMLERRVLYAPGESRSATWQSQPLVVRPAAKEDASTADRPLTYGLVVASHGALEEPGDETFLRFSLHRFTDPIQGQILTRPDGGQSYYFTAPVGPDQHVVVGVGSWHPNINYVPTVFDARALNDFASYSSVIRYGTVSDPKAPITLDEDGDVVVGGKKLKSRLYWGGWDSPWVLGDQVDPSPSATPSPAQ
jgi:hypothetical protein